LIPGRDTSSYNEHIAIFNAIKNHDCDAAANAMQQHINNLKTTFEENLDLIL
jgi:DNA-binding FadR family transcriptional regulator